MSRQWIRRSARWKETLGAAFLAGGVAVTTFYLARLLLARDPLPEPPRGPTELTRADDASEGQAS